MFYSHECLFPVVHLISFYGIATSAALLAVFVPIALILGSRGK